MPAEPGVCTGAEGPGGLVIMVDGVILGKQEILLGALPIGQHEMLVQIVKGPVCHTYKQIELVLSSACEYDMMGDMCIVDPLPLGESVPEKINPDDACRPIIESSAFIEEVSWSEYRRRRTTTAGAGVGSTHVHNTIRNLEGRVLDQHQTLRELKTAVFLLVGLVGTLLVVMAVAHQPRGAVATGAANGRRASYQVLDEADCRAAGKHVNPTA